MGMTKVQLLSQIILLVGKQMPEHQIQQSFAEVTDLELFVALYKRFGIDCKITRDEVEELQIIVFAGNKLQEKPYSDTPTYSPKFFGWDFIVTRIIFDLKGNFISQVFIDDFEDDEDIAETTALPWDNEPPTTPLSSSNQPPSA